MSEVLQANVFFFIASVAVIAFTILVCVALYQVIKILGSVRQIAKRVEEGSGLVAENISNLGEYFKKHSFFKSIFSSFFSLHIPDKKAAPKPRRKKIKREDTSDKEIS